MEIDVKEIFLNQYASYIANNSHESFEAARKACGDMQDVKTVKFVRASEEEQQ